MINWVYAKNFGELPTGQAEIVEALVVIAEQLAKLNENLKAIKMPSVITTHSG